MANRKRGPEPGTENARRGGLATSARHGPEWYAEIGRRGGRANVAKRGGEHYAEIGKKGGNTTMQRHGREYYVMIGRKGGAGRKPQHEQTYTDDKYTVANPASPAVAMCDLFHAKTEKRPEAQLMCEMPDCDKKMCDAHTIDVGVAGLGWICKDCADDLLEVLQVQP